jgi:hypothetical protein
MKRETIVHSNRCQLRIISSEDFAAMHSFTSAGHKSDLDHRARTGRNHRTSFKPAGSSADQYGPDVIASDSHGPAGKLLQDLATAQSPSATRDLAASEALTAARGVCRPARHRTKQLQAE